MHIAALLTLGMLSVVAAIKYPGNFGIFVHLPVDGDCSKRFELIPQPVSVRKEQCKNFPPFHAMYYFWGMYRKKQESPYRFGLCTVKVYSGEDCSGRELLHIPNANGWENIGHCWGGAKGPFNVTAGRSIKVERCKPFDRKDSLYPKAPRPADVP